MSPLLILLISIFILLNLSILLLFYAMYLRLKTEKRKSLISKKGQSWDITIESWLKSGEVLKVVEEAPYEFLNYLHNKSERFNKEQLQKLGLLICHMKLDSYLLKALKSNRAFEKAWAIHIAGYFYMEGLKEFVKPALKHKNNLVKQAAFQAMARLVKPELPEFKELLQMLLANFDEWTTEKLGETIILMGNAAGSELLVILKSGEVKGRQLWFIIDMLGEMEVKEAVPVLLTFLDKGPETVTHAVRSLGLIRDIKVKPEIVKLLKHKEWIVRAQAAKILGYYKDASLIPPLADSLEDDEWWVRHNAANSIAEIGYDGIGHLQEIACTTQHTGLKDAVVFTLQKFGVKEYEMV